MIAAVIAGVVAALAGCDLVSTADDYPDDYEQAIIEALDDSDVVAGHEVEIDAWKRAENIPDPEVGVQLVETVTAEQWHELMMQLADLAQTHDQAVPALTYDVEPFAWMTIAGHYTADEAAQLLEVATGTDWGHLLGWFEGEDATIYLRGGVQDAVEGEELVGQELPAFVTDHLDDQRVRLPDDLVLREIRGTQGPINAQSFALAFALDSAQFELPSVEDSISFELTTQNGGVEPIVLLETEVRSDELGAADPDDRPGIAAELGYRQVCAEIESLLMEHITDTDRVAHCTATHVDIS